MKHSLIILIAIILISSTEKAQWIKTNGPSGSSGIINSIAIGSNYIFAATTDGSIYRSTNKGTSWLKVFYRNSNYYSVSSIATNGSFIYAGTNDLNSGYGIYQSSNNGNTWTPNKKEVSSTAPLLIYSLGVHDSLILASTAYGAGAAGMFRSTDNGNNWTRVSPSGVTCYAFQDSNVFATVANPTIDTFGVYFSNDLGKSWSATNFPRIAAYSVAVKGKVVFVGTGSCIYKSTDNGISWKIADPSIIHAGSIVFSPTGDYVYAGAYNGFFRSENLGETWEKMINGLKTDRIYSLAVYPSINEDSSYIFAGTGNGIYLSTDDGEVWSSSGLPNNYIPPSKSLASKGSLLVAGAGYKKEISWPQSNYNSALTKFASVVYFSMDNGSNWKEADSGIIDSSTQLTSLCTCDSNIFAGTYPGGIFYTSDKGKNWINSNSGLNNKYVYALTSIGSHIFAGTDGGVNLSTDNGLNWYKVNSGLSDTAVRAFTTSGSNLFAGTITHKIFKDVYINNIFFSTDFGSSWSKIDSQLSEGVSPLITSLSAGSSYLLVGKGNKQLIPASGQMWSPIGGIYRFIFDGSKWNRIDSALIGHYVTSIVSTGLNFFAGTYTSGVFNSTDNGVTWNNISDGLADSSVVALVIHDSYLFAATSSGVYRRSLSEITSVPPGNKTILRNFRLEQNYPNPFNPTTTIDYILPKSSFVTIKVFDLLGREVTELVNEEKSAGKYSILFEGSNLSSGIYFYSIDAGGYHQVKKMIFIK